MPALNPFPYFDGFTIGEPDGLGYESGVTRRDPSVVIEVDGSFHVWYSRNTGNQREAQTGFTASIYHAVSDDGHEWRELGEALSKGDSGRWDACGVFTPTVYALNGRFWMLYTAMPERWLEDPKTTKGAIGLAVADSVDGPWERFDEPAIRCGDDPDAFDSLRVDDACVVFREGRILTYYKGRAVNRPVGTTKMGLAIADRPEGPYIKQAENPVLHSGHEVCVWPHGRGVGCLVANIGPEANTLQYSPDGRSFEKVADTVPPKAPGPLRKDLSPGGADAAGEGITWGLAMTAEPDWPHLIRFDTDLRAASNAAAPDRPAPTGNPPSQAKP